MCAIWYDDDDDSYTQLDAEFPTEGMIRSNSALMQLADKYDRTCTIGLGQKQSSAYERRV